MGADKAFVTVRGEPLVLRSAWALRGAGASEVLAIGGDLERLARYGLRARPDAHPGEGPLGGIITALELARRDVVVVLACDLPRARAGAVFELLDALHDDTDVVMPRTDRLHPLFAAYRRRVLDHLQREFDGGERAPHRAVEGLAVTQVRLKDEAPLLDVDTPGDLAAVDLGRVS